MSERTEAGGPPTEDELELQALYFRSLPNVLDARADHKTGTVVLTLKQPIKSISFTISVGDK